MSTLQYSLVYLHTSRIKSFDPSTHASYILIICWCRTHHDAAQQSFAESAQDDTDRKGLPHCVPESKRVQGLITVQTTGSCRIIVGLKDWEDPHITCRTKTLSLNIWLFWENTFSILNKRSDDIFHPYLLGSRCSKTGLLNTADRLWLLLGAAVAELHGSHRAGSQMVSSAAVTKPALTGSWGC